MPIGETIRPFARWMMPGNDALYHGEVVRIKGVWSCNGERQFGCQARNGVVILASDSDIQEYVPSTAASTLSSARPNDFNNGEK